MDDADGSRMVILVVGNLQEEKAAVVDSVTKHVVWDKEATAAGVRIFTHKSGDQVIDTIPLRHVQGRSSTAIARRWISQNSLRRIVQGRLVFVVCVVTSAIVEEACNTAVMVKANCWLDVLKLIFQRKKDILILATTEGEPFTSKAKTQVKQCLRRHGWLPDNVLFTSSGTDEAIAALAEVTNGRMFPTIFTLRPEKILFVDRTYSSKSSSYGKPFLMSKPSSKHSRWDRDQFGPWGPERVFLFGRTGTGKSTLAQMLTSGKLDKNATKFKAGSGIKGKTEVIEHGEGRGWYVVDTPGFGEPDCESSTVTTHVAQGVVKDFVEWKEGTFSHYLFVMKRDRVDSLEVKLWAFFKLIFGEKINHHFSIVVSNADEEWLASNISYLQTAFEGCSSFLPAEFPSNDDEDDDEELEMEYEVMRAGSLRVLEEELAKLGRSDLVCEMGEHSTAHRLNEKHRAYIDANIDRSTAVLVDIIEQLGFVSLLTSVDDFVYRLSKILSADKVILESL